jgi:BEN domain
MHVPFAPVPFGAAPTIPSPVASAPASFPYSALTSSIDVSGVDFLSPGPQLTPIPIRQSTPLDFTNALEWSLPTHQSPPSSQYRLFDNQIEEIRAENDSSNLVSRIRHLEHENGQLTRKQEELLTRIIALETFCKSSATSLNRSAAIRLPQENFTNKDILRVKASVFLVGRPITYEYCQELVQNVYDNEPSLEYNIEKFKNINDLKHCCDAPHLSKSAVLEFFSIGDLAGRNCLGRTSTSSEAKKPLDQVKLKIIKDFVFQIYPERNDEVKRDVWNKCVEKINAELRYLFGTSLKKQVWLKVGLSYH